MKSVYRIIISIVSGIALTLAAVALYGALADRRPPKAPVLPDSPAAVITHLAGPVFLIRGSQTLPASPGDRLEVGDIVKVTEDAVAQVQMADRGTALLDSNTLIRFLKFTGADKSLEVRTEILTGTLYYKVDKLDQNETLIVETDGTVYEVRGTEFLVRKRGDRTLLAVQSGQVNVSGGVLDGDIEVSEGEELQVLPGVVPSPTALTKENRSLLETMNVMPVMPFGGPETPEPILVEILTDPGDADIYLDGLKTGTGRFRGLIPPGTELKFRIRRRGFQDVEFSLKTERNIQRTVVLQPLSVERTLIEPQESSREQQLRFDYENSLLEFRKIFENAVRKEKIDGERREKEQQIKLDRERIQRTALEAELAGSQAENARLRELLSQIRVMSDTDDQGP